MIAALAKSIFGSSNDRYVRGMGKHIDAVNGFEPTISAMTDDELRGQTELFRRRLQDRLALGFLISTALGYERDVLGHGLGGATDEQGQTRELESCSAQCAHGKTPNGWQIFLGEL